MTLNENTLKKIVNFGALKLSPLKICKLLRFTPNQTNEFLVNFDDESSEIRMHYDQGVAIGDYNIDAELAKKAEKGDVFCIQELNNRQYYRELDDLTKELFGI